MPLFVFDTWGSFLELWKRAGGQQGLGIGEKNRFASDQIRLRMYCYGLKAANMPAMTNIASGLKGAQTFMRTLKEYFKRAKDDPLVMVVPLIGSHRRARQNLDGMAVEVVLLLEKELDAMADLFFEKNPEGVFVARRHDQPQLLNRRSRRPCNWVLPKDGEAAAAKTKPATVPHEPLPVSSAQSASVGRHSPLPAATTHAFQLPTSTYPLFPVTPYKLLRTPPQQGSSLKCTALCGSCSGCMSPWTAMDLMRLHARTLMLKW